MKYSKEELWPFGDIEEFIPVLNDDWNRVESEADYIERMKCVLPHVPVEVLREWFFRHWNDLDDYVALDFKTLRFERQTWPLDKIPRREAFADPELCDSFSSNIELRLKKPNDWLLHFMMQNGTWNTPILLLENPDRRWQNTESHPLRSPIHLLEGHRRLSFLQALRTRNIAQAQHEVWLVTKVV